MLQLLLKIASYPSTILGSIATITTLHDLVQEAKNGSLTFNYYFNTGISFLSALALPITKAILNKLTYKLYFKAIKTYTSGSSGARL